MNRSIKVGLLGCGRVADRYVDVFQNEIDDYEVAAVCDPVVKKAEKRSAELDCQAFSDERSFLKSEAFQVVCVLTESGNHYRHSKLALLSGKHVLVEKPAAFFPDEVRELELLARNKNLFYGVVHQNRFNPAIRALKEAYDRNDFGKISLATIRLRWCREQSYYEDGWHGTWAMDGGVVSQQALHHLDALRWINGPIKRIVSSQSNCLNQLEAEDTTLAVLEFENGSLGAIEATTAARPEDIEASISILGETGTVVVGGIALNEIHTWRLRNTDESAESEMKQKYSQSVPTGYGLSHGPLIQESLDRVSRGELQAPVSGSDAIPVIQLFHAIYKSTEVDGWVQLSAKPVSKRLGQSAIPNVRGKSKENGREQVSW